jgi:hypothetical protein
MVLQYDAGNFTAAQQPGAPCAMTAEIGDG